MIKPGKCTITYSSYSGIHNQSGNTPSEFIPRTHIFIHPVILFLTELTEVPHISASTDGQGITVRIGFIFLFLVVVEFKTVFVSCKLIGYVITTFSGKSIVFCKNGAAKCSENTFSSAPWVSILPCTIRANICDISSIVYFFKQRTISKSSLFNRCYGGRNGDFF